MRWHTKNIHRMLVAQQPLKAKRIERLQGHWSGKTSETVTIISESHWFCLEFSFVQ